MRVLFCEFNRIADMAKRGLITISEAMHMMEETINLCDREYQRKVNTCDDKDFEKIYNVFHIDEYKAYHRMFKILHDLTKSC